MFFTKWTKYNFVRDIPRTLKTSHFKIVYLRLIATSVAEPKLPVFDSAPAPAPTFKKFRLRLRLELCGCLFSQLLNEKVDFS